MGAGANLYVAAGDAFAAIVHVLESTGRFKIVSRPTIFTSNNKKAIIASGQEVPVPMSTLTNVNRGTSSTNSRSQSSIEYKKVVLQLEVVPLINSEKEVSLDILQKVDSIVPNGAVNISGNQVPTIDTKYIRTNVSAQNGSTIILGGLIEDQKNKRTTKVFLISRAFHSSAQHFVAQQVQEAIGANRSYVSAGDSDQAGSVSVAPKMGGQEYTFWARTRPGRVRGLPQN